MKKGYFYIIFATLAFSTMEVVGKMIANGINPFQLTFLRFLIGGLILLPFALKDKKNKELRLNKNDFLFFAFNGLLSIVVCMSLFQLAIVYTQASTVAVIFSTNPVFTIPFAFLILKESISKKTFLSLVFSFIGILFILNPFRISPDVKGIVLSILAAVTFSLYSVIGKLKMERYGGLIFNAFTFLTGDAILLLFLLIFKVPVFSGINTGNIFEIIYLGIVVTGLGYLTYFMAMKETSATTASTVFFIKPALAPIFSYILLKEIIPFNTLIGIMFILLGAYMIFTKNRSLFKSSKLPAA